MIGDISGVTQSEQTVAVVAFDDSRRTETSMFHYVWRLEQPGLLAGKPARETRTSSPVYRADFDHDGYYRVKAYAVDRYGLWSEPRQIDFSVVLPKASSVRNMLVAVAKALISSTILYFALIFPLIPLYPRYSWARTAVNSGLFTKFPFAHKAVLNTSWARSFLFRKLAETATTAHVPSPYIPQSIFPAADEQARSFDIDGSSESLGRLFADGHRVLLIARSGTGKSVFLRHLQREVAIRFLGGEKVPAPVLIDLRTNVLSGRKVQDLIRDALRGAGVELDDGNLDFLISKGDLLILVELLERAA